MSQYDAREIPQLVLSHILPTLGDQNYNVLPREHKPTCLARNNIPLFDVSIGLQLDDKFNSSEFIKGHAIKIDNSSYEMAGSAFLQSFFCKPVGKERVNCTALSPQPAL